MQLQKNDMTIDDIAHDLAAAKRTMNIAQAEASKAYLNEMKRLIQLCPHEWTVTSRPFRPGERCCRVCGVWESRVVKKILSR